MSISVILTSQSSPSISSIISERQAVIPILTRDQINERSFLTSTNQQLFLSTLHTPFTPQGWACICMIYGLIQPGELPLALEEWPQVVSQKRLDKLKILVSDPSFFQIHPGLLENPTDPLFLQMMYSCGLNLLKTAVSHCCRSQLKAVVLKKPIHRLTLIRDSLERHPFLKPEAYLSQLMVILGLLNGESPSPEDLLWEIQFYQALVQYPSTSTPFKVCERDQLFIFLSCMFRGCFANNSYERMAHLYDRCLELKAIEWFARIKVKVSSDQKLADTDFSHIQIIGEFLKSAYTFCDAASFAELISTFHRLAENAQKKPDDPQKAHFRRKHWLMCSEMLYGFNVHLMAMPLYTQALKILDTFRATHPLATFVECHRHLFSELFANSEDPVATHLCIVLQKVCWFGLYMHGRPHALSDRLIDWYASYLFLEKAHRHLSCEHFVATLEDKFRKAHPFIPFNSVRAWSAYHKHTEARKKLDQQALGSVKY